MLHVTPHDVRIPALGLGTFGLNGRVAERIVGHALDVGYRHIDTAQMYGNEAEVGAAIRRSSGAARRDLADHQDLARPFSRRSPACAPPRRACAASAPSPTSCCCTGPIPTCRSPRPSAP